MMNRLIGLIISVRSLMPSQDEDGQGLVEYALILLLISVIVFGVLAVFGDKVSTLYNTIQNDIPG